MKLKKFLALNLVLIQSMNIFASIPKTFKLDLTTKTENPLFSYYDSKTRNTSFLASFHFNNIDRSIAKDFQREHSAAIKSIEENRKYSLKTQRELSDEEIAINKKISSWALNRAISKKSKYYLDENINMNYMKDYFDNDYAKAAAIAAVVGTRGKIGFLKALTPAEVRIKDFDVDNETGFRLAYNTRNDSAEFRLKQQIVGFNASTSHKFYGEDKGTTLNVGRKIEVIDVQSSAVVHAQNKTLDISASKVLYSDSASNLSAVATRRIASTNSNNIGMQYTLRF